MQRPNITPSSCYSWFDVQPKLARSAVASWLIALVVFACGNSSDESEPTQETGLIPGHNAGTAGATASGGNSQGAAGSSAGGTHAGGTGALAGTGGNSGSGGTGAQAGAGGTNASGGTGGTGNVAGTSTGGSAGAPYCGQITGSPSCDTCIATECCDASVACDPGTPCDDLLNCLDACKPSDQTCQDNCVSTFADGVQPFVDYYQNCKWGSCNTDCAGEPCMAGGAFNDPAVGACVGAACCEEFLACTQNDTNVQGCIDCLNDVPGSDPTLCQAAKECIGPGGQGEDCFPPKVCDSGISFQDPAVTECVAAACCAEFDACTMNATDVQACIDCLNGEPNADPTLCEAANTCYLNSGCSAAQTSICDTGISFGDATIDMCVGNSCCAEYQACVGDGSQNAVQACLDCLNAGGTDPLCEPAATCTTNSGCQLPASGTVFPSRMFKAFAPTNARQSGSMPMIALSTIPNHDQCLH